MHIKMVVTMKKGELIKELKKYGMSVGPLVLKPKRILMLYRNKFKLLKAPYRCKRWREI